MLVRLRNRSWLITNRMCLCFRVMASIMDSIIRESSADLCSNESDRRAAAYVAGQ